MGILDRATEAAKSAVSTAGQAVSNAAQQVGESIQSAGESLGQRFSDDDADAETEAEADVEQEQQEEQQEPEAEAEVEPNGIDPDETPDNVVRGETADYNFLLAKEEYRFRITPTVDPSQYQDANRAESLTEWVNANILTDEFESLNVEFNKLQFAVKYDVIQDGEVFAQSRRRSEIVSINAPQTAEKGLKEQIEDLRRIQEDSYEGIDIFRESIILTQTSDA